MGYLAVAFAALCGAVKGYAGKKSSETLRSVPDALRFCALRTAGCALLGAVLWLLRGDFRPPCPPAAAAAVLSGVSMSVFLLSWTAAVRGGAYVRLDVCCQTGMVIPCVLAAPLLGERASAAQYIALAFLLYSVVLLSGRAAQPRETGGFGGALLLFAVWLSSGINSLTAKLYAASDTPDTLAYTCITFGVSAPLLGIAYGICRTRSRAHAQPKKQYALYLPLMTVCLFLYNYLTAFAAKLLPSLLLFPLQTGLGLLLSCLMSVCLFGERLTRRNALGALLALFSMAAVNGL